LQEDQREDQHLLQGKVRVTVKVLALLPRLPGSQQQQQQQ
jgi:hypothetical protein